MSAGLTVAELLNKLSACERGKPVYMASDSGVADGVAVVDVEECADCVTLVIAEELE